MKVQAREGSAHVRCALCHGDLAAGEWTCRRCATQLHAECVAGVTSCPTLGCGPLEPPKRRRPSLRTRLRWALGPVILVAALAWTYNLTAQMLGLPPYSCLWRHVGHVDDVVFSPESDFAIVSCGRLDLVSSSGVSLGVIDPRSKTTVLPRGCGVERSGHVLRRSRDGSLLFELDSFGKPGVRSPDGSARLEACFARDGRWSQAICSSATGAVEHELDLPFLASIGNVAFSRDGARVIGGANVGSGHAILVWSSATGRLERTIPLGDSWAAEAVAEGRDGEILAVTSLCDEHGTARAALGLELRSYDHSAKGRGRVTGIDAGEPGATCYALTDRRAGFGSDRGRLRVVSTETGATLLRRDYLGAVRWIRFSPDGTRVAAGVAGSVLAWELPR